MITVTYTSFGSAGSVQKRQSVDGDWMTVTAGDKGEPLLNIFLDVDEEDLLAIFRTWDFAVLETGMDDDKDPVEIVDEMDNVFSITADLPGRSVFKVANEAIPA